MEWVVKGGDGSQVYKINKLVKSFQEGNTYFFEDIINESKPIIENIVSKYRPYTRDDPEDLKQIAYIQLWHVARTFNFKNPSFFSYAKVCIERAVLQHVQKEYRQKRSSSNSILFDPIDICTISDQKSYETTVSVNNSESTLVDILSLAKKHLSYSDRVLVYLYLVQDISIEEISNKLGLTYSAASKRVYRLTERLATLYKEEILCQ